MFAEMQVQPFVIYVARCHFSVTVETEPVNGTAGVSQRKVKTGELSDLDRAFMDALFLRRELRRDV